MDHDYHISNKLTWTDHIGLIYGKCLNLVVEFIENPVIDRSTSHGSESKRGDDASFLFFGPERGKNYLSAPQ
jgi:hypothetical protein